jgi:hypothetical protein
MQLLVGSNFQIFRCAGKFNHFHPKSFGLYLPVSAQTLETFPTFLYVITTLSSSGIHPITQLTSRKLFTE